MIWLIVVLVILGVLVAWFFGTYNGLVKLRNLVEEAWAQIDVELKRRHDLIGNLVETVKGYAAHERGTLEAVTRARTAAMAPGQSPASVAKSEAALTQALVRLTAVAEAYPELKANENFTALQSELGATEDRIASARRYYNANVRELNTKVDTVPTNLVAGMARVGKREYFELDSPAEREAPRVSFDPTAAAAPITPPPAVPPPSPIQDAPAPQTAYPPPQPPAAPPTRQ